MGYDFTEQQIIEAIKGTAGLITDIARHLGCSWHACRAHIDKHEATRQAYQDELESMIDLAESKLKKRIEEDDAQMIKFFLATKGKKRGYTEKTEIEHTGDMSVSINIKGVKSDN